MFTMPVNSADLPGSIRRDGGNAVAVMRPRMPEGMRGPRAPRLDGARIVRSVQNLVHMNVIDANETSGFARTLLYIMPTPYMMKYPGIRYAELFPINYSVPTGAKSHAYHEYEDIGNAQILDDYGDDPPNVEQPGGEILGQIYSVRSAYSYSIQDIRSAAFSGIPLDAMKASLARRIIERKCDQLAATGDTKRNFTGIVNDPNATSVTPSTKAAGGTKWGTLSGGTITVSATANEIINDVTGLLNGVNVVTRGTHTADTLVVGTQNWNILNTLRLDTFNMVTVARYLLQAIPTLKSIEYWPQLDVAGASAKERVFATERNSMNYEIIIPQEFEQFAPQPKNMALTINCHKRFGGVQMRFPKSCAYMDGTVP